MLWKVGPAGEEAGNSVLLMSLGVKEPPGFLPDCPHSSEYQDLGGGKTARIVALSRGQYYAVNWPFL